MGPMRIGDGHLPMLRFRGLGRRTDPSRPAADLEDPLTHITDLARQAVVTLVWLLAALLIALGAAGVVAGMDTPAADGSDRTGRTGYGDAHVDASLDAIESEIGELSVAVEMLGQHSRVILASLSSNSTEAIDTATAQGTALVGDIKTRVEEHPRRPRRGTRDRDSCRGLRAVTGDA